MPIPRRYHDGYVNDTRLIGKQIAYASSRKLLLCVLNFPHITDYFGNIFLTLNSMRLDIIRIDITPRFGPLILWVGALNGNDPLPFLFLVPLLLVGYRFLFHPY